MSRSQRMERVRNCPVCGTEFIPSASNAARGWGICCSPKCKDIYRSEQKIKNLEATFWSKVNKTDNCWLWTGSQMGNSKMLYGEFRLGKLNGNKKVYAHRFSWELVNGSVPEGMCVLHNCPDGDNPLCVNPAHLWLGTRRENTLDMHKKGRYVNCDRPFGEKMPQSKLTIEKVHEIDRLTSLGWSTYKIAEIMNVSSVCIHHVVIRKTWKQVLKLS